MDPKVVDDNKTKNVKDVTLSYTFFSSEYYKNNHVSRGKKHEYHLVDPSPWPIFVSFATLVLAVGTVYYLHAKALWLMLIGLGLLFYGGLYVV